MKNRFHKLWGDAALYGYMLRKLGSPKFEDWDCIDGTGRLWRNPEEQRENESPYAHGTSRDMMLGSLLGASRADLYLLQKYLGKNNGRLSPSGDGRTVVTASGFWQLYKRTGVLKGLTPKQRLLVLLGGLAPRLVLLVEMLTAWKGYQFHLTLVTFWLYRNLGVTKTNSWFDNLFLRVAEERSKGNHLVAYLRGTQDDLDYLKGEAMHARNQANYEYNVWKDAWNAAYFEQWVADRMTSHLYADFVQALATDLENKNAN